ncbi:metalloprotease family protein [Anaeromicropila herbilytica]|uniref:Zincin peptidase n=1 Tax=Anaeromicropila herbilytica TaxID=2785025 RepID=A0A7R7IDK8_9FIRM|nr:metalloprotease family protein [Anaeromicropila herbilytica]BCN31818.1 hypothetical protein bsdtb5_31130 [Anaeromicropila herbilytica]
MLSIIGYLVSIITFPGVIVHEAAHQLFCRINKVAVLKVCYFQFQNPFGYLIHEKPDKAYKNVLIGIGPFFVNTIIGAIIALPGAIPVIEFETGNLLEYFLIWLGVSIAMHSFPSIGDAKNIWKSVWNKETGILLKIIATPIVGLIYLGAVGSILWLDLIYGIAVAMFVPNLLVMIFA